jgi:hypothetical protein
MSRFPVVFRPPAFASQVIRPPLGDWASLAVGLPDTTRRRDPNRVPTFHTHEMRPGRVPPVSRGRRCSPGRQEIPGRRLPLPNGQPLNPTCNNPSARLAITRHQRRFTRFTRPVCPLPVTPGWSRSPSASPRASHPASQRRTSRAGPGQLSTDLVLRNRHRPDLRSASTLATCDLVSHFLLRIHRSPEAGIRACPLKPAVHRQGGRAPALQRAGRRSRSHGRPPPYPAVG